MATRVLIRSSAAKLVFSAIVALASVIPFMFLELINRRRFDEPFPVPLFVTLWILSSAFVVVGSPIARGPRSAGLAFRVTLLALIAWLWGGIVMDQMPCFLGGQNCD